MRLKVAQQQLKTAVFEAQQVSMTSLIDEEAKKRHFLCGLFQNFSGEKQSRQSGRALAYT